MPASSERTSTPQVGRSNEIDWGDGDSNNGVDNERIPGPRDLRIRPLSLRPSIADTMLGNFNRAGGDHKIIERSPTCACIELSTGKGRGLKRHVASMTWDEALREPGVWNESADVSEPKFFQDSSVNPNALKEEWRTQRGRTQMLWEHAVFDGIRCMMPAAAFDSPSVAKPATAEKPPRDPRRPPVAPAKPCKSLDECAFYTDPSGGMGENADKICSALEEILRMLLRGKGRKNG